jgi:flagellar hook-associated protein 2
VFASDAATVGTGTLTLTIGDAAFSVDIDSENNTLAGIRDAINAASDNTGVEASIINADSGSVIVFSGAETGSSAAVSISQAGGDGGLAALTFDPAAGSNPLTQSQEALDAQARVNSLDVFSATNTFDAVIDGVSFTALEESAGEAVRVSVQNDTDAVKGALSTFTVAYNSFVDTINQLSSFDPETNEAGPLQGDSTLRAATNLLRRELSGNTASAASALDTLTEIGISLDENGKLTIDDARLDTVLADNFRAVQTLFGADDGYVARLTGVIDSFTGSDGVLETRTDGIQNSIEGLALQNEALNQRLVSLEARLLRQFNCLDSLLAQLNNTSNFLSAQLSNLPTPGSNNAR